MGVTVVSMFQIEIFLMLLSLWGAQGRDGLDTIASDDYWKIKQVQVTRELLERFAVAGAEVVATSQVAQLSATWRDDAALATAIADTENLTKNLLTQIDKELARRPLAKDGLSGGAKIWLESLVLTPKAKQLTARMDISEEFLGQFMGVMTSMLPTRSTTRVVPRE